MKRYIPDFKTFLKENYSINEAKSMAESVATILRNFLTTVNAKNPVVPPATAGDKSVDFSFGDPSFRYTFSVGLSGLPEVDVPTPEYVAALPIQKFEKNGVSMNYDEGTVIAHVILLAGGGSGDLNTITRANSTKQFAIKTLQGKYPHIYDAKP